MSEISKQENESLSELSEKISKHLNSPKVSIIVPVYNVEKFLNRCIDSLLSQTLKDIEIICINDGSTDKSLDILKNYESKITIITQENQGLSATRNNGMVIAKGEYIAFVDSDDWVDVNFFEKLYNAAKNNNADIAVGGIIRLHKLGKKCYIKFKEEIVTSTPNKKFELCDVPEKSYVWNKIYKKEFLSKIKLKFVENLIYEDCIFTPQALYESNKLVVVPNTYYYYWRHSNTLVTIKNEKAKTDKSYAQKWAEDYMNEHNLKINLPVMKRYKFLGLPIYKTKTKNGKTEHRLFNIIKWQTKDLVKNIGEV